MWVVGFWGDFVVEALGFIKLMSKAQAGFRV